MSQLYSQYYGGQLLSILYKRWKEERDFETHINSAKLYETRMVEIEESKEMIETLRLYDALLAVNHFLTNAHARLLNYLIEKYRRGEIKEE